MKIAIFLDRFEAGGVETHTLSLAKEFLRRGHEVLVYTNAMYRENSQYLSDGHPLFQYKLWSGNLAEEISSFNPDIIHAHPFQSIGKGFKVAEALKKPLFITSHGRYPLGIERNPAGQEKCTLVKKVIAVDHRVVGYLEIELACPEKIVFVPNGIDLEYFHPVAPSPEHKRTLGLNSDWFTIAYISRIEDGKQKPVYQLFQNAEKIAKLFPGLNILIVGGGAHYQSIEQKAKEISRDNVNMRIITFGHCFDIRKYVAAADLIIGVGRVALEAQAMQRPVLTAYPSGYKGLLSVESYDKYLFRHAIYPCFDDEQLLDLFSQIAAAKIDLHSMAADFRKLVQKNHDITDIAARHEQLYLDCL